MNVSPPAIEPHGHRDTNRLNITAAPRENSNATLVASVLAEWLTASGFTTAILGDGRDTLNRADPAASIRPQCRCATWAVQSEQT